MLILIALSVSAQAASYYVATNGNDSTGTGSISAPYATLTKAVSVMSAGDVTYMRGGRYSTSAQINMTAIGTSATRYTVTNYPGEVPTLDYTSEARGSSEGIRITGAYWQLYGLVITNAAHNGINIRGGTLTPGQGSFNWIERCCFVGCSNSGFMVGSSGSLTYLPGTNTILNCDAWLNFDGPVGGNADGFSAKWYIGTGNRFVGCRSWNNSDDGWDLWMGQSPVLISNCWTWGNGSNIWKTSSFAGNGNGFKLGGNNVPAAHRLLRGLAYQNVGNGGYGIDENNNTAGLTVDQCVSWGNLSGDINLNHSPSQNEPHLIRNNVAFGSVATNKYSTLLSNSWQVISGGVTSNDFVSMDASQLATARQADGSLPVITLVHPVAGGRLVDKGVIISDQPYCGSAPDLGAYEICGGGSPPTISQQPQSTTNCSGAAATFSVTASGTAPLYYQWQTNSVNLVSGGDYSGVTSNVLTVSPVSSTDAGSYRCIVTNASGSVTSSVATLTVSAKSSDPTSATATATTICSGQSTALTLNGGGGGTGETIHWYSGSCGGTSVGTGNGLVVSPAASTTYYGRYEDGAPCSYATACASVTITVSTDPFECWRVFYFGCTDNGSVCAQAAANADPYGKGISNTNQFLIGLNPTNPASVFEIVGITQSGGTNIVTWKTSGGDVNAALFGGPTVITNIVQGSVGAADGGYSNNFSDISGPLIVMPAGDTETNYSDAGGTNLYYRIRLGP
ncbi:MAG TPA: immunoglobulin domain-containing protein [Verrucomicrobiae bacterium]|nr:immunoglobulin domain-containing protein [Verrucomicrobiae bacterium]